MNSSSTLIDPFGRRIDYLRVSVTDRCNFRCVYCMPEQGVPATPKAEMLTAEELRRLVRVAASLGMRKMRFTGGEPLLRKDLSELIAAASNAGVTDISVTTNGYLLEETAVELKRAGLTRLNLSLDTLQPARFKDIARRGDIEKVLAGYRAAREAGIGPIKINCVAMKGYNDDEFAAFAAWTREEPVHVRFIELMPIRWDLGASETFDAFEPHGGQGLLHLQRARGDMLSGTELRRSFISAEAIRAAIESELEPMEPATVVTNGPARSFRLPGAPGTVGFISQITHDFCSNCNRLRLTHDGFLRPCLMSDGEIDLRTALREGLSDMEIANLFIQVVSQKPERHYLDQGQQVVGRSMSQIGG